MSKKEEKERPSQNKSQVGFTTTASTQYVPDKKVQKVMMDSAKDASEKKEK